MRKEILSALTEGYTDPIRDVLWGHIYLTPELASLTACAPFMRLHRINQLGPVFRVYPGATHTRASHSIGVYHLGRRLLQNLAERGADAWLSPEGIRSFLCACLLHDLGHFPYTHSLKELPLLSHEALTGLIVQQEPVNGLVEKTGANANLTAAIIDKDLVYENSSAGSKEELLFYRKLLSGSLDPDKLDYLNRDARYCGVPYGIQDVDFIFSRLYPHRERGVDIDSRLIPNVESILFSKYLMYRTVYWHRQVRSATAMIKKALLQNLELGILEGKELYNLDDQSLFVLLRESLDNAHGSTLVEAVWKGQLFVCAAEIPYVEENHSCLIDIHKRSRYEEQLSAKLRAAGLPVDTQDIIIDVPEPVSFETGLFVLDEERLFSDSSCAFTTETVNAFIKTLYTIRIFINPLFEQKVRTLPELHGILNISEKWLY